jgi:hypothetical protein
MESSSEVMTAELDSLLSSGEILFLKANKFRVGRVAHDLIWLSLIL